MHRRRHSALALSGVGVPQTAHEFLTKRLTNGCRHGANVIPTAAEESEWFIPQRGLYQNLHVMQVFALPCRQDMRKRRHVSDQPKYRTLSSRRRSKPAAGPVVAEKSKRVSECLPRASANAQCARVAKPSTSSSTPPAARSPSRTCRGKS